MTAFSLMKSPLSNASQGDISKLVYAHAGAGCHCNFAQMLMVREIYYLSYVGHFAKQWECFLCAVIIEGFHDVIGDKRHRTPRLDKFVISGHTHRHTKLKTGALRHIGTRQLAQTRGGVDNGARTFRGEVDGHAMHRSDERLAPADVEPVGHPWSSLQKHVTPTHQILFEAECA